MKRKIALFIFTLILVLTGITNINAYDKYDGDYTIEYLLKNYNVVTLGTKERYNFSAFDNIDKAKGSVTNVFDIGGPVLIRGNYTGSTNLNWDNEFAQKTNCIPSYIKGKIGDKIKAGSIESAELSNIYVGSSNKVTNNDGYYTVNNDTYKFKYPVRVSDDYVDFDKLYASIVNEQENIPKGQKLFEKGKVSKYYKYNIDYEDNSNSNKSLITITTPGYYEIEDINLVSKITIANYNPNDIYIITTDSEIVNSLPVFTLESVETFNNSVYYGRLDNDIYAGNIIWNVPNARYLYSNYSTIGHIIAPKADVELTESYYPGTIIANSITSSNLGYTAVQFYPYNLDKKFTSNNFNDVVNEEEEINKNDLYNGNYSIDELLKNYSVVTLGTKEYDSSSKLKNLTNKNGTASIFHIGGQFLINGDLGVNSISYNFNNSFYNKYYNGIKLDLRSTDLNYNSYLAGSLKTNAWDSFYNDNPDTGVLRHRTLHTNGVTKTIPPVLYFGNSNYIDNRTFSLSPRTRKYYKASPWDIWPYGITNGNARLITQHDSYNSDNYIDFKTLYGAIVEQQKKIDGGILATKDQYGIASVKIGENNTIENVNQLKNIRFTNYNENKNKLTIITINDYGTINMPVVGYGYAENNYVTKIFTNDYIGGYTFSYDGTKEIKSDNNYYGNIVWNFPNATKIILASYAPFVGHVIAPNADVETPELHFAGAMICNSLYTEGHTEAHFYPLTVGSVGTGIKKEIKTIGSDEVEKITISGTKTWDDNNNQDGLRPESVTINLLANGEKIDSVEITEKDNWKYSFSVPRVDENGIKINYTITEDAIEHYATNIESFSNDTCPSGCKVSIDGYNITNSYTPKKTSLTVNKVWKDENNADKLRPESVEVELYANGKKVSTATLNEENNWTYIFNEIDMNENGKKVEYTVKEKEKIKGYTTSISGDQETGYTITNTHVVKKENPTTGDNIKKFLSISIMSLILLGGCIVIFTKYRNKKA